MSRSYKRIPCCKDCARGAKKYANRYVRRNCPNVPSGAAYKRLYESWNICDYKFLRSFRIYKEDVLRYSHRNYRNRSYADRDLYKEWYKYYKMK